MIHWRNRLAAIVGSLLAISVLVPGSVGASPRWSNVHLSGILDDTYYGEQGTNVGQIGDLYPGGTAFKKGRWTFQNFDSQDHTVVIRIVDPTDPSDCFVGSVIKDFMSVEVPAGDTVTKTKKKKFGPYDADYCIFAFTPGEDPIPYSTPVYIDVDIKMKG